MALRLNLMVGLSFLNIFDKQKSSIIVRNRCETIWQVMTIFYAFKFFELK